MRFRAYLLVSTVVGFVPTFFFVWLGSSAIENPALLPLAYVLVGLAILAAVLLEPPLMRWLQANSKR